MTGYGRVPVEVTTMPANPTPAPEWAVKMVAAVGEDYAYELEDLRQRGEPYLIGTNGLWYQMHALLLAGVRDAALREAAARCRREASVWEQIPGTDNGAREVVCDDLADAILALVGTAPKEAPRG